MKFKYYIFIFVLFIILAISVIVLKSYLDFSGWIVAFGTFGAIFAALTAGIIALGSTDKPPRFIDFTVKIEVDEKNKIDHDLSVLPPQFKKIYKNKYFYSYRVYFKIKNESKFTIKRPVITFRLPKDLQHPHKLDNNKWIIDYRSNLYNVQIDLRTFKYEDVIILSNVILPYLNKDEELSIWIRMCLNKDDSEPRPVFISLNCDNAEGITKELQLIPKNLLKDIE